MTALRSSFCNLSDLWRVPCRGSLLGHDYLFEQGRGRRWCWRCGCEVDQMPNDYGDGWSVVLVRTVIEECPW